MPSAFPFLDLHLASADIAGAALQQVILTSLDALIGADIVWEDAFAPFSRFLQAVIIGKAALSQVTASADQAAAVDIGFIAALNPIGAALDHAGALQALGVVLAVGGSLTGGVAAAHIAGFNLLFAAQAFTVHGDTGSAHAALPFIGAILLAPASLPAIAAIARLPGEAIHTDTLGVHADVAITDPGEAVGIAITDSSLVAGRAIATAAIYVGFMAVEDAVITSRLFGSAVSLSVSLSTIGGQRSLTAVLTAAGGCKPETKTDEDGEQKKESPA